MLGLIKPGRKWNWSAYGKHPSAKDYFHFGRESAILKSFSSWVGTGYEHMASKTGAERKPVAWRFWARGEKKENIVCGLVRDSCDSLGRPYPFLMIGTGNLKDWEEQWDFLPIACEKTWSDFEYLSSRMFKDPVALEANIKKTNPPYPEWSEFKTKRKEILGHEADFNELNSSMKEDWISGCSEKNEGLVPLNGGLIHDQYILINYWHILLKSSNRTVPNAVFMGGTSERDYIACFKRPLQSVDFVRLWSISLSDNLSKNVV